MDCNSPIIQEIKDKMREIGDLPLFSATINSIHNIGSNPDSNAAVLSKEITKDLGLTTTLLRLANSSYYSRGSSKVSIISRAIVLLGFETIMNLSLTLKLIDSFQNEHPSNQISRLLVTAYQAASLARDLAIRTGIRNVEEIYTCTLLHKVGEISVAYFLPEKYESLQVQLKTTELHSTQLEISIFGTSIDQIGQCMAASWEFPNTIVHSLEHFHLDRDGLPRGKVQLNCALSSLSNDLVSKMHQPDKQTQTFSELISDMTKVVGIDSDIIENCLIESYRSSSELATIYGLNQEMLIPNLMQTDDPVRDRMANRLAYLNQSSTNHASDDSEHNDGKVADDNNAINKLNSTKTNAPVIKMDIIFQHIQEITSLISSNSSLNLIFNKTIEGIQKSAGFDRVILCLISPDKKTYAARLHYGTGCEKLMQYFSLSVEPEADIFSTVLLKGNEIIVNNTRANSWKKVLKNDFFQSTGCTSFIISGVLMGKKPIGFFFADNLHFPPSTEQHRCFSQFVSQVRLALKMMTG